MYFFNSPTRVYGALKPWGGESKYRRYFITKDRKFFSFFFSEIKKITTASYHHKKRYRTIKIWIFWMFTRKRRYTIFFIRKAYRGYVINFRYKLGWKFSPRFRSGDNEKNRDGKTGPREKTQPLWYARRAHSRRRNFQIDRKPIEYEMSAKFLARDVCNIGVNRARRWFQRSADRQNNENSDVYLFEIATEKKRSHACKIKLFLDFFFAHPNPNYVKMQVQQLIFFLICWT